MILPLNSQYPTTFFYKPSIGGIGRSAVLHSYIVTTDTNVISTAVLTLPSPSSIMSSAAEKSYQLQLQMKRNTEEMGAFLSDLSEWSDDMKKKDDKLKEDGDVTAPVLPPIRSQPKPKKKKNKKKKQVEESVEEEGDKKDGKEAKIRGYDYRAWDRFDVDAALKEVDGSKEGGEEKVVKEESSDESTDDEELEKQEESRKIQQAMYQKEKGNSFFKSGKWEDAVECYTKGLQLDSLNAVLFANRAMALLKLQKYGAAITDCDCSIELDQSYTKAYARRATAHLKLGQKTKARDDFKKVLEHEPDNKLAINELNKLEIELQKKEYTPKKPGDITHIKRTKPPSEKPMIRMHIYDIAADDYEVKPKKKTALIEEVDSGVAVNGAAAPKVNSAAKKQHIPQTVTITTPLPTRVPANSLQFQTDVRKLKNHPDKLFEYIKQIDADVYPKLFQESLEADMLFLILDIFESHYVANSLPIEQELYYLSTIKRFNMAVMFMSSKQEKTVRTLFGYALKADSCDTARLEKVKKLYNIS